VKHASVGGLSAPLLRLGGDKNETTPFSSPRFSSIFFREEEVQAM
jgi:hypothetical protein